MSIFSKIKDAIFGRKAQAAAPDSPAVVPTATPAAPATPAPPAQMDDVDVEAQLAARPGADDLNWRTSIVDLFKLLDIDASYENRKELAQELGRSDYAGSAEDNIWLHKATMKELAANGGRVPADMLD